MHPGARRVGNRHARWPARLRDSGDRLVSVVRHAIAASGLPEIVSPLPQVGSAWRRLPDGRLLLALLNYGDAAVEGITIYAADSGVSAELYSVVHEGISLPINANPAGRSRIDLPPVDVEAFVLMS